ncbi:MAG: hypothetical protein K8S18_19610 [Desulfobacula sp.]|nr:hypothetical protein [Desulfobacula sp.]
MSSEIHEMDQVEAFIGYFFKNNELILKKTSTENNACQKAFEDKTSAFYIKSKSDPENISHVQASHKKNIFSFFWGEIYNYKELCIDCGIEVSDSTQVTFSQLSTQLYIKYGKEFAIKINGIFNITIFDGRQQKIHLYADRYAAARPVYYYQDADVFIFSNKLKKLLIHENIQKTIDKTSIALFLKYSYIPSPGTMIKEIKKLQPGEVISIDGNGLEHKRYIDFEVNKKIHLPDEKIVEKYTDILKKSIIQKIETSKNEKIGIFLSGGLDSSANVALAASNAHAEFETFGVGFADPDMDERPYAKVVADFFNKKFNDYVFNGSEIVDFPRILWHLEEPFIENGLFLTYAGFKSAKGKVDVVIAGDGADQLFGTGGFASGRPIALRYILDKLKLKKVVKFFCDLLNPIFSYKENGFYKAKKMFERALNFNDWFFWGFDDYELKKLCNFQLPKKDMEVFKNSLEPWRKTFADYYDFSIIHQDIEHYVCQNVLVKSFRIADLFNIKLRESYLDNNVIDFLSSLEMANKTKGGLSSFFKGNRKTKYLHRQAMAGLLPDKILNKPKQGGCITMTLLLDDNNVRKSIFNYILSSIFLEEYLNTDYVKSLLENYEKTLLKPVYWQSYRDSRVSQIMNIFSLLLWYDLIYLNTSIEPSENSLFEYISTSK